MSKMSWYAFLLQPPMLCKFQTSSYVLAITTGNRTWLQGPKLITNTSQQVEEDIDNHFEAGRTYNTTVTVFTEYANITSTTSFSESL